ncbi:MAG: MFS transporter [Cuniculiplasma sp.]
MRKIINKPNFSKNFLLMITNRLFLGFSLSIVSILFVWIILTITGSPLLGGALQSIEVLPLLFSVLISYLVSRMRKRKPLSLIIAIIDTILLSSTLIAFLSGNKFFEILSIFVAVFLISLTRIAVSQIHVYWNKEFLAEEQYQSGNSFYHFLNEIFSLAGYIVAGISIAIGFKFGIEIIVGTYIFSIFPLLFIDPKLDHSEEEEKHSFGEGLHFFKENKKLLEQTILLLLLNFAMGGSIVVNEFLVKVRYNGSPFVLTILLITTSIGAIVGSIFSSRVRGKAGPWLLMGTIIMVPLIVLVPLVPSYFYLIPLFFASGIVMVIIEVIVSTIMLKIIPQDYVIQVHGTLQTLAQFPSFFAGILMGGVMQFISMEAAFFLQGAIFLSTFILLIGFRNLRNVTISEENNVGVQNGE